MLELETAGLKNALNYKKALDLCTHWTNLISSSQIKYLKRVQISFKLNINKNMLTHFKQMIICAKFDAGWLWSWMQLLC